MEQDNLDVLYVIEQDSSCAWYRCRVPGMALANAGHNVGITTTPADSKALTHAMVAVWQRPSSRQALTQMQLAHASGVKTVVDIDDDMWDISRSNPAWPSWNERGRMRLNSLSACIKLADFVTVTTVSLADKVRPFSKNVIILPNMIPDGVWSLKLHTETPGKVVIGWAGSNSHADDLSVLSGCIETVLDKYPEAEFHCAGMLCPGKHERIINVDPVPIQDYESLLSTFDIGLAPVNDTAFNRSKSDLKLLEYAACGIPVIASKGPTYSTTASDAVMHTAKNPKQWIKYLSKLIEMVPDARFNLSELSREYLIENRMSFANAWRWEEAYKL
jgi:glycosyltransferase involved in cell wall biosynthesis